MLLGLVSYGAYLFHWPVFVLLSARGWSLSSPPSFAVAVAVTLALAGAHLTDDAASLIAEMTMLGATLVNVAVLSDG